MEVPVIKSDIGSIGHTAFDDGGLLSIVCSGQTSGMEGILLRNILRCFGEQYTIIDSYDQVTEETDGANNLSVDVVFKTNLPYPMFVGTIQ